MDKPPAARYEKKRELGDGITRQAGAQEVVALTVVVNEGTVIMTGKTEYVFVDIFEHIDFDLSGARGRQIVTQLNGRVAQFMEPLTDGDVIDVYWSE
jgi:hypothetical protein